MKKLIKIGISSAALAVLALLLTGCSKSKACDVCGNNYPSDGTVTIVQGKQLNVCPDCTKSLKVCDVCQKVYSSGGTTTTVLGREVNVCSDCTKSATGGVWG